MDATGTGFTLRLERAIAAPPEKVYDAFTKAETLARWFAPTDDYVCVVSVADTRVGGRWALQMRHKGGNTHDVGGTYRIVDRPDRLSFTMAWAGKPDRGDTVVTVTFTPTATGTQLVLVHEHFPTAEVRDAHQGGWGGSLPRLAAVLEVK